VTDTDEGDDAHPAAMIEYSGADTFILIEGRRIAKRGHPGTLNLSKMAARKLMKV